MRLLAPIGLGGTRALTLYLDSEFNGFGGELISLALVSDRGGEFYGVRNLPRRVKPWVRKNVVPRLGQPPEIDAVLRRRLAAFLFEHEGEDVVADWPEDLSKFLAFLCVDDRVFGPGNMRLMLVAQEPLLSVTPHNALSDARALMQVRHGNRCAGARRGS